MGGLTGVEQIMWSYGTTPNFHQQSTMASKVKWLLGTFPFGTFPRENRSRTPSLRSSWSFSCAVKTAAPAVLTRLSSSSRCPPSISLNSSVTESAYCLIWVLAAGLRIARPAYTCHLFEYIRSITLTLTLSMPPTYRSVSHGNWLFAYHAVPMLRKAAWVTACVSAVIWSCLSAVRMTCLDWRQDRILWTRSKLFCDARCLMRARGWPLGSTFGPCREWHDTIWTSGGRFFSNAAISGALHDVWPPTIAPCFVAEANQNPVQDWDIKMSKSALHGPYIPTILSIDPASTLYIIQSLDLETRWPLEKICTLLYLILATQLLIIGTPNYTRLENSSFKAL